MKITDVEFIRIYPPMAERYEGQKARTRDLDNRVVARVRTSNGLVGYGEERVKPSWNPPADSILGPMIGRSPVEFIHHILPLSLGGALYDVLGKHLEVPAYKLMGRKMRDGVTVAAWCPDFPADVFAGEIVRAAGEGYNIIKMHTNALYDPIEQTRAAEEVAPAGFKVHYDFNGGRGRTVGAVLPLIGELERDHPIVGWIEDLLPKHDIDGWRTLRAQTGIPVVMHRTLLGGLGEAMLGAADIFIIGDGYPEVSVADTLARGIAYGKANVQVIMQLTGGTLAKALALHMAAVLPTATGHSINLDDQYAEDITRRSIPVAEGYSPVPEGAGLGVEVDEEALARMAARAPSKAPRHVGILLLPEGHRLYTRSFSYVTRITGREEGAVRGIDFELWDDDGSAKFEETYARLEEVESFTE